MELFEHEKAIFYLLNKESKIIIFDIGAHKGESTIRYKEIFENANIYCFEPVISNFNVLLDSTKLLNDIQCHNLALSDNIGETVMYLSNAEGNKLGSASSSLLVPTEKIGEVTPWIRFDDRVMVKTTTIDKFCKDQELSNISFIHMDVQGAEIKVLNGASNMLSKTKLVWLEVENVELYRNQPLKKDVEIFMKKNGFRKLIDDVNWIAGDQLWVENNYLKMQVNNLFILRHQIKNQKRMIYYFIRHRAARFWKKINSKWF